MRTFEQFVAISTPLGLTGDALDRFDWAMEKGLLPNDETPEKVLEHVWQKEVIEYCTVDGGVLFDIDDVEIL